MASRGRTIYPIKLSIRGKGDKWAGYMSVSPLSNDNQHIDIQPRRITAMQLTVETAFVELCLKINRRKLPELTR